MKTLKQLREHSGKSFTRTIRGGVCIEDIPKIKQELENLAKETGEILVEDEKGFCVGERFFRKPRVNRIVDNIVIIFRSQDYIARVNGQDIYGCQLLKENLIDNGFSVPTYDGATIEYTLSI